MFLTLTHELFFLIYHDLSKIFISHDILPISVKKNKINDLS
jgi:hypothetical protein